MKSKYERLSRREKKEVIKKYRKDNYTIYKKIKNYILLCYIGIIYSIIAFIYDFYMNKIAGYVIDIVILILSLISLLKVISIKNKILNDYVLKNKKDFQ